jgi:hypothetical protein
MRVCRFDGSLRRSGDWQQVLPTPLVLTANQASEKPAARRLPYVAVSVWPGTEAAGSAEEFRSPTSTAGPDVCNGPASSSAPCASWTAGSACEVGRHESDRLTTNRRVDRHPATGKAHRYPRDGSEPDSKLDEYREARAAVGKVLKEVMATGDEPSVVAEVVLKAATAARPKLRYTAGGLARRLRWLRRFAPAGLVDAGVRKNLQLDAAAASGPGSPVLVKP